MTRKDPVKFLRDTIERAAFYGHDLIVSGGHSKRQHMGSVKTDPNPLYFRCQWVKVYIGDKVDAVSRNMIDHDDYRTSTIINDAKNNRAGTKEKHGSHRTDSVRCFIKLEDKCSFQLSLFHNSFGYYIKSKIGNSYHEFRESRPYLRMLSRLVEGKEATIIHDIHSGKAMLAVAVNTHFIRTSWRGTPTLLSNHQIKCICTKHTKKKKPGLKPEDETSGLDCYNNTYKLVDRAKMRVPIQSRLLLDKWVDIF